MPLMHQLKEKKRTGFSFRCSNAGRPSSRTTSRPNFPAGRWRSVNCEKSSAVPGFTSRKRAGSTGRNSFPAAGLNSRASAGLPETAGTFPQTNRHPFEPANTFTAIRFRPLRTGTLNT